MENETYHRAMKAAIYIRVSAEDQAKVVKLIYTMYLYGKSTIQIGKYLYQNGYRSRCGNPFTHTHILGILKNPVYRGGTG